MEGKQGAEGMESKPEEGVWLEREQHEGYRAAVSGELHTGQAEATSGRTGVQAPSPHPHQCCRLKKCLMGYAMAAHEMFLEVWGHRGSDTRDPSAPLAVLSRAASPLQGHRAQVSLALEGFGARGGSADPHPAARPQPRCLCTLPSPGTASSWSPRQGPAPEGERLPSSPSLSPAAWSLPSPMADWQRPSTIPAHHLQPLLRLLPTPLCTPPAARHRDLLRHPRARSVQTSFALRVRRSCLPADSSRKCICQAKSWASKLPWALSANKFARPAGRSAAPQHTRQTWRARQGTARHGTLSSGLMIRLLLPSPRQPQLLTTLKRGQALVRGEGRGLYLLSPALAT